ncbi:fatty acid hydroxylase superfamily-domain-containing protein [Hyaloraphidium curvatum]|nr:fatty acid hydroxylase superfamily-domain-containing protein [Hyaloraphidium curvatum]
MADRDVSIPVLLAQSFVTQAAGYFAVVGGLYQLVWRWGRERFLGARIPNPGRLDGAQLRREIAHTMVTMAVGTSSAGTVIALHARGRTRIVDGKVPIWNTLAWSLAIMGFNDLWFYCWHRLLHHPKLFRHVHAVHHRSVDVNPFTSYSFHAVESFILGIWILPAALLLPIPMSALGLMQVVGLANNVMSHLGYEFLPRWLLRVPVLRWMNTATYHSLHHSRKNGNFGLMTRFWDRLFGTEVPDYEQVFLARGEAQPKPEPRASSPTGPAT